MSRKTERVEFHGANGDLLAGRLDRPEGEPYAYALFAHCFTCSKDIWAATRISIGLAELGIAVLRFDFTGLGSSEGEFANTNFSSNVGDLVAAAEFMRSRQGAPNLLVGHSLGGAAVLASTRCMSRLAWSTRAKKSGLDISASNKRRGFVKGVSDLMRDEGAAPDSFRSPLDNIH